MDKLTDLFKLVELTRSQPQYGYALTGIKQDELSNLAEHHYLVTFIAWQLALHVQSKGAQINIQKVLEFALIHDLGELFGGDIASHVPRQIQLPEKRPNLLKWKIKNLSANFLVHRLDISKG